MSRSTWAAAVLTAGLLAGSTGTASAAAPTPTPGASSGSASAEPDPAIPPIPAVSPSSVSDSGAVNQQDVDNLNGILSSVGGAVTSVRSAMTADSQTPKG